jgi:hypothetical protein
MVTKQDIFAPFDFCKEVYYISPVITNKAQNEHNNRDLWPWAPYASVDVSARFAQSLFVRPIGFFAMHLWMVISVPNLFPFLTVE